MSTVDRIFALLKKNHLNAKTVATAVGHPPSKFTEWKKGRSKPSSDSLRLLADYFGVSVDYLLGRVEAPDDFFTVAANRKGYDIDPLTDEEFEELFLFLGYLRSRKKDGRPRKGADK